MRKTRMFSFKLWLEILYPDDLNGNLSCSIISLYQNLMGY
jgi:hypothetical protein